MHVPNIYARDKTSAQALRRHLGPWRVSISLGLVVLAVGAALTWLTWLNTVANERHAAEQALIDQATHMEHTIKERLLAYEAVLRAGVGLFEASDRVSEDEWHAFARQLQSAALYPGLQGLGYVARVAPADDADGRDRTAIVYLEPRNTRNVRAIGFDMMSEETRRRAMERARDEGTPSLSGRVTLVQEITEEKQAGFLLYLPVYRNAPAATTVAQRRRLLRGFVYSPLRAGDFLDTVFGTLRNAINVEIYDAPLGDGPPELIYRNRAEPLSESIIPVQMRSFELLGHRWLLRVAASDDFFMARTTSDPQWVILTGGITTVLLACFVWALALSRQRLAEKLFAENAARQRERYSTEVLENSLDAYIAIDTQDRIVEWNGQAEQIFGWPRDEVRGRRLVDTIVPARFRAEHQAAIENFAHRSHSLLGKRVTMPAVRSDKEEIIVELSILAITRGEELLFVASLRDITELRRHEEEIVALNASLEQRVAQRTKQLAEANRELHAVNQQLEAFAQNVSHDLRGPLRAVGGYTQIAIDESGDSISSSARGHLMTALRQVQKMQTLVDDLLKLAFIGRQQVQKRAVNLWTLTLGVIDDLHLANPPAFEIKPDELGDELADPALIEHALRNLISNAVKFSQSTAQPRVCIGSENRQGERVYFVRDNGVGFDPQYASKLFRVFHRLHSAEQFEGTGVGLSIVKSVIEKHGGRVWAESTPGEGATFYFTLEERWVERRKRKRG